MRGARVVVKISPSRLEAVLYRGNRAAARRLRHLDKPGSWTRDWPSAIGSLQTPLMAIMTELRTAAGTPKGDGEHATIIYAASPSAVTHISSCHVATGETAATDAAELGLANLCPFPLDENVFDTQLLYTDPAHSRKARDEQGAMTPAHEKPAMLHMASSADTLATSVALAALARGTGLIPDEIVPAEALVIRAAVDIATTAASQQPGTTAVLWMSDHGCALAAATRDPRHDDAPARLAFVRSIGVGIEAFVDALTKPLHVRTTPGISSADEHGGETITLNREAARRTLAAVGIPAADTAIPGQPSLSGASLLPALHPVLQRLSVEVKQSIRFGLPDSERGRLRLVIAGSGTSIPNLAPIIARQSGIDAASANSARNPESPAAPSSPPTDPVEDDPDSADGFIDAVQPYLGKAVNLSPPDVARSATIVRIKQAMWLGVGAALALIGFDAYTIRLDLAHERERLGSLQSMIQQSQDEIEVSQRAMAARAEMQRLRTRIQISVPHSPDWAALLASISTMTPLEARLTDISGSLDISAGTSVGPAANHAEPTARCRLVGYMATPHESSEASVSRQIDEYLAALGASPIIAGTQLGPTRVMQSQLGPARSFEITLVPVVLPASSAMPPTAGVPTGQPEVTP